jgi:hypothetical protein
VYSGEVDLGALVAPVEPVVLTAGEAGEQVAATATSEDVPVAPAQDRSTATETAAVTAPSSSGPGTTSDQDAQASV